tara:strand:+ start:2433 stop:2930 length:498 start_codon:yes stop_codon:yes gene_type:complete
LKILSQKIILKILFMEKFMLLVFFCCTIMIFSCNTSQSFTHSFVDNNWHFEDSVVFTCNIEHIKNYNLELFFRNNLDYPYRNLYLLVEIHHNQNIIKTDTLQYPITDRYGKWLGRGLGKTRDNYFLEKLTMFEKTGKYKFIFTHGMRQNPLTGSNTIGMKIILND